MKTAYITLLAIGLMLSGCRESTEQPERWNVNLGTDANPLLPSTPPNLDSSILQGRADYAELGEDAPPDEELIADLIKRYKTAVANDDMQAQASMLVADQSALLTATADEQRAMVEKMRELVTALKEADPPVAAAQAMVPQFEAALNFDLTMDNVNILSETEAVSTNPVIQASFVKENGQWRLRQQLPITDEEQLRQLMQTLTGAFVQIIDVIKDESLSAQERDAKMMPIFMQMATAMGGAAAAPPSGETSPDS